MWKNSCLDSLCNYRPSRWQSENINLPLVTWGRLFFESPQISWPYSCPTKKKQINIIITYSNITTNQIILFSVQPKFLNNFAMCIETIGTHFGHVR